MKRTGLRQRWLHRLRRRLLTTKADESGITTLEWLLIVAAVAGLAALAVVLVQNVVNETSEQIAGSSARKTAATVAADQLMRDAAKASGDQPRDAKTWGDWRDYYTGRCERLEITYGDAGIDVAASFRPPSLQRTLTVAVTGDVTTGAADAAARY